MIICKVIINRHRKAEMLELNKWFFVLLLNFLVLLFVLNLIFFKPLLRLFADRERAIKGPLEAAREMEIKKEEAVSRMTAELKAAREKAKQLSEDLMREGMQIQKEALEGANIQAHGLIEKAKRELKTETEKARQTLRSDIEEFSDDIVRKLAGI